MKKIIGYIGTWMFYYLGHFTSKLMYRMHFLYKPYQWFMMKSFQIQDWANLKSPWK